VPAPLAPQQNIPAVRRKFLLHFCFQEGAFPIQFHQPATTIQYVDRQPTLADAKCLAIDGTMMNSAALVKSLFMVDAVVIRTISIQRFVYVQYKRLYQVLSRLNANLDAVICNAISNVC
jgi:hypothetical protein